MFGFLKNNFRWIAGGYLLTYFSSIGQTFFISASVSDWQAAFDLSHGEFGQLYMVATLASALTLPFLGRVIDHMSEVKVISFVIPVLGAAALLAGFAPSVFVLTLAIYLLRLFGQGMMTHIALTTTGRWFSAQRGRAVSLVVLGHQGGEFTIPLLFAAITLAYGLKMGWVVMVLALLLVGFPLALWAYKKPRTPYSAASEHPREEREHAVENKHQRHWTRREVLRDPVFYLLLTGTLAPAFIGTVIFFHQDYLTTLRGWPPQYFAFGMSLMALTTTVVALINGVIIDRFGAKRLLPFCLLPLAACCFVTGIEGEAWLMLVFMFLLGISYGVSSPMFGALWPEVYGTRHLGAVRSVTVSAMVLGTAAGPGITGMLIDRGIELPDQLRILGVYCVLACFAGAYALDQLKKRDAELEAFPG